MELRHLRYFVAVAEELHYTRAAARLETSQPSLSQQIIQLERHVGTPLLARTKRRVQLTAAGRVFFRQAKAILTQVDRATDLAAEAARGRVRELSLGMMAAAETVILPKLMPRLAARLPQLRVGLHSFGSFQDQLTALRSHAIDVGFLWGPLDEPDLTVELLYEERFVVVLPASHRLATAKAVGMHQLDDLPGIVASGRASPSLRHTMAEVYQRAHARVRMRPVQDADNVLGHLNMVRAGLGFAVLPEYVRAILPAGVRATALAWEPAPRVAVVLAHLKDGQPRILDTFKHVLRESLGLDAPGTPRAASRRQRRVTRG